MRNRTSGGVRGRRGLPSPAPYSISGRSVAGGILQEPPDDLAPGRPASRPALDLGLYAIERDPIVEVAVENDRPDALGVPDVLKRIGIEQQQVCGLAALDASVPMVELEVSGGCNRRCTQHVSRRQSRSGEMSQLAMQVSAGNDVVRASEHLHTCTMRSTGELETLSVIAAVGFASGG